MPIVNRLLVVSHPPVARAKSMVWHTLAPTASCTALVPHTLAPRFFELDVENTFRCSKLTWKRRRRSRSVSFSTTAVCLCRLFQCCFHNEAVCISRCLDSLKAIFSKSGHRVLDETLLVCRVQGNLCLVSPSNMSPLKQMSGPPLHPFVLRRWVMPLVDGPLL